jgi:hypothetical protein
MTPATARQDDSLIVTKGPGRRHGGETVAERCLLLDANKGAAKKAWCCLGGVDLLRSALLLRVRRWSQL